MLLVGQWSTRLHEGGTAGAAKRSVAIRGHTPSQEGNFRLHLDAEALSRELCGLVAQGGEATLLLSDSTIVEESRRCDRRRRGLGADQMAVTAPSGDLAG